MKWTEDKIAFIQALYETHTYEEIAVKFNKKFKSKKTPNAIRKAHERYLLPVHDFEKTSTKPKILMFDVETLPIEAFVWSIWQDSVNLDMVIKDWSILGWAAKWHGGDEIFYADVRNQKDLRDDKAILEKLHKLLDEADFVVGHNSDAFDIKKVNARFAHHGMKPPSSYKRLDTKKLAKKHFAFTSNKLSHLTDKFCKKYKKLKHNEFPGVSMWLECIARNPKAFACMEEYNKYDVLSLEELFNVFLPWESATIFNNHSTSEPTCSCGSTSFKKSGFYVTNSSKFQKYKCTNCGAEARSRVNLIDKHTRNNSFTNTTR
jgi:hypothetical protein